jgi:hypothetical protein
VNTPFPKGKLLKGKRDKMSRHIGMKSIPNLKSFPEVKNLKTLTNRSLDNPQPNQSTAITEVRFASFFSGGFITAIVVNQTERKLAKRTSEQSPPHLKVACKKDGWCKI